MCPDSARSVGPGERDELASELTVTIAEAVGDAKGVDPITLTDPLYDAVDPEPLADFVRSMRSGSQADGAVSFAIADCRVTVDVTGEVLVRTGRGDDPVRRSFGDGLPGRYGDGTVSDDWPTEGDV